MLVTATSMEYEITFDDERPKRDKLPTKYPNAKSVFKLWPGRPLNWNINPSQLNAAENLFVERGMEAIKDALEWYQDMATKFREDRFFPLVKSPYDLDSKWDKLEAFNDKHS